MIFCDLHASMADFSDARLNRWIKAMGRIHARFDLVNTLAVGEIRRFQVTNDLGESPILVRFEHNGSFEMWTTIPILYARVAQRPFGMIWTWIYRDGTTPSVLYPWVPAEHPGVFNHLEEEPIESLDEATL